MEAAVVVDLADDDAVVMEDLLVLEVVAQEAAVTEVALEVGLVNQEVADMAAEAADTAVGSVDKQGA